MPRPDIRSVEFEQTFGEMGADPRAEKKKKQPMKEATQPRQETDVRTQVEKYRPMIARLKEAAADPTVYKGAEASLRAALIAANTVADTFPKVFGTPQSWGAKIGDVWTRYQYVKEQTHVEAAGGDPSTVKMKRIDLTPDVSDQVTEGANLIEILVRKFLSERGAKRVLQLGHDRTRIMDGLKRLRDIMWNRATVEPKTVEAAAVFQVVVEGDLDDEDEDDVTQEAA